MLLYPHAGEHKWAFGDLTPKVMEKTLNNPYMRDIFTEASPYEIKEDGQTIVYYRGFRDREKYRQSS